MELLCIKNFHMKDKKKVFTAGKTYPVLDKFKGKGGFDLLTINDLGERHIMPFYDDDSVKKWFEVKDGGR